MSDRFPGPHIPVKRHSTAGTVHSRGGGWDSNDARGQNIGDLTKQSKIDRAPSRFETHAAANPMLVTGAPPQSRSFRPDTWRVDVMPTMPETNGRHEQAEEPVRYGASSPRKCAHHEGCSGNYTTAQQSSQLHCWRTSVGVDVGPNVLANQKPPSQAFCAKTPSSRATLGRIDERRQVQSVRQGSPVRKISRSDRSSALVGRQLVLMAHQARTIKEPFATPASLAGDRRAVEKMAMRHVPKAIYEDMRSSTVRVQSARKEKHEDREMVTQDEETTVKVSSAAHNFAAGVAMGSGQQLEEEMPTDAERPLPTFSSYYASESVKADASRTSLRPSDPSMRNMIRSHATDTSSTAATTQSVAATAHCILVAQKDSQEAQTISVAPYHGGSASVHFSHATPSVAGNLHEMTQLALAEVRLASPEDCAIMDAGTGSGALECAPRDGCGVRAGSDAPDTGARSAGPRTPCHCRRKEFGSNDGAVAMTSRKSRLKAVVAPADNDLPPSSAKLSAEEVVVTVKTKSLPFTFTTTGLEPTKPHLTKPGAQGPQLRKRRASDGDVDVSCRQDLGHSRECSPGGVFFKRKDCGRLERTAKGDDDNGERPHGRGRAKHTVDAAMAANAASCTASVFEDLLDPRVVSAYTRLENRSKWQNSVIFDFPH